MQGGVVSGTSMSEHARAAGGGEDLPGLETP